MDDTYAQLATVVDIAAARKPLGRLIVGVAGCPGSGKSTIAEQVVNIVNSMATNSREVRAQAVSLDGFHYARSYLDRLSNRKEAYARRGAPWTFDVDAIVGFVNRLIDSARLPAERRPETLAPYFDHTVKDPVPDDVVISPTTSIVILDGNYLLLDEDKWRDLSMHLDLKIFVDVDPALARDRVARRHVAAGIESTVQKGQERFDANDALNGDLIRKRLMPHDIKVESVTVS